MNIIPKTLITFTTIALLSLTVVACDMPDISHLSPTEQLQQLDEWEREIKEDQREMAQGTPWGYDATDVAINQLIEMENEENLAEISSLRANIISENPELSGSTSSIAQSSGNGINLANVSIGQNVNSVSLSGQCGLPLSAVSESDRRSWYSEARKGSSPPSAFLNNNAARAEILSLSTPPGFSSVCEATSAQVYAFLPSLNQSIAADKSLHNGPGVGLRCGSPGASGSAACTSVNTVYNLKIVSFMCHQVCDGQ